jgi:hypothetical protein
MTMARQALSITLLVTAMRVGASANDLEAQLNKDYKGKFLTFHQFCSGGHLRFDADGHVVGNCIKNSWTTDSQLQVESIKLKHSVLELYGRRLCLIFDPANKHFRDVLAISPKDEVAKSFQKRGKKAWQVFLDSSNVEVDLDLASRSSLEPDLVVAIDQVFWESGDLNIELMPAFWRDFLSRKDVNSPPAEPPNDGSVYKVGGKVAAPHVLSQPDPEYSELARQAGYSGTLVLSMVVTAEGNIRDVSIVTPLGLGLDEKAVNTVGG